MCGIFGIHFFDTKRAVNINLVQSSTDLMHHRGPDDSGYYTDGNIGLGHRRLSIIDLSSGHQPMCNEDESLVVVYNGEIYNYKDIQKDLMSKGHKFRTNCDTEVILHGYKEWGKNCLEKFNGMFAFILFDKIKRILWIARDRLGIKPLYYYLGNDFFIAASEVKAIIGTGLVRSALNERVVDAYFSVGYVPGPETMFKGIKKLLPGHYLTVSAHGVKETEYWDFSRVMQKSISESDALERMEELFSDCVQKRMISDVPVGAFLSGGLDSSIVVGLMEKLISPMPVNTFTVAYNQGYSEKEYAQVVAEHFRTNHQVFYLEAENFFDSLKTLLRFSEEPIVEPAAIALYHISKLARENAIVLLSGEGSDELLGGYYLYQLMDKIENGRSYLPDNMKSKLSFIIPFLPKKKYQKYLDWFNAPLSDRYQGTSSYLTPSLKKWLYNPDFLKHKSSYLEDQFDLHFKKVSNKDLLSQMLYVDTKTWLVDDLLIKADKMTMAASIELRVPFLDYRLVEFLTSLPSDLKIRKKEGKYLLKKLAENVLPNQIIYRKKMGFPVPTKKWFKGNLVPQIEDAIIELKKSAWFQPDALEEIITRHKRGIEDHSKLLMTLLVFSEWQNQYSCE